MYAGENAGLKVGKLFGRCIAVLFRFGEVADWNGFVAGRRRRHGFDQPLGRA